MLDNWQDNCVCCAQSRAVRDVRRSAPCQNCPARRLNYEPFRPQRSALLHVLELSLTFGAKSCCCRG